MLSMVLFEMRKGLLPFLVALVGAVPLGLLNLTVDATWTGLLYALFVMISSVGLYIFAAWTLYSYFWLGRDVILHLPEAHRGRWIWTKSLAMGVLLYGYFLLTVALGGSSQARESVGYLTLARLVSIGTFLSVVFVGVLLAKSVKSYLYLSILGIVAGYVAVTVAQAYVNWWILADSGWNWSIGISDSPEVATYVNALPIEFTAPDGNGSGSLWLSVVVNVVVTFLATSVGAFMLARRKYDFFAR